MERGRGRGGMLAILLVQALSEYGRLDRKPPVTAGLIAANTLIYLRPKFLDPILPTINQVWFNPHLILKHKDLKRFVLSAFYHIGEPHLVYNMLSLLWKGIQLESSMGSIEFASMVTALVGMSQGITLLLAKGLLLFDYERAYYNEYAVGFSGVLFAMKVILYSQSDNYAYVQGLMVPARYAAWAELILIQMWCLVSWSSWWYTCWTIILVYKVFKFWFQPVGEDNEGCNWFSEFAFEIGKLYFCIFTMSSFW